MKKKLIAVLSALALAGGLGVGAAQFATADTETPTPAPSASPTSGTEGGTGGTDERGEGRGDRGPHGDRRDGGMGADLSALAEKLGVEEATLQDAMDNVRDSVERPERPSEDATAEERQAARDEHRAALAKALAAELGIDEAKVTQALDELETAARAERAAADKEVLDKAVADGELSQAEADAVQKALDADIVHIGGGGRR